MSKPVVIDPEAWRFRWQVLTTPSIWVRNQKTCLKWDAELNCLMETHRFEVATSCTARLGGVEVWTANHPYASFSRGSDPACEVLPRRTTALRAMEKFQRERVGQKTELEHAMDALRKLSQEWRDLL